MNITSQEFLRKYATFSEETKRKCFSKAHREILDKMCFIQRMFEDADFYNTVYEAVATEFHRECNA